MCETVKAEILNLSASILLGRAKEKDIKHVTELALKNSQGKFLADEFRSVHQILKGGG